jgi:hypothetical protein
VVSGCCGVISRQLGLSSEEVEASDGLRLGDKSDFILEKVGVSSPEQQVGDEAVDEGMERDAELMGAPLLMLNGDGVPAVEVVVIEVASDSSKCGFTGD